MIILFKSVDFIDSSQIFFIFESPNGLSSGKGGMHMHLHDWNSRSGVVLMARSIAETQNLPNTRV